MDKRKLGRALVHANKLTEEKLKYALTMHEKIGGDFAPLLVKLGYITDEDLTSTIAKLEGISTVDVSSLVIPANLVKSIPRNIIEKHNVIPINKKNGQITLAMSDVADFEAIDEIQFLTGCRIEPVLASREAIRKAIIQFFYGDGGTDLDVPDANTIEAYFSSDSKFARLQRAAILLLIKKKFFTEEELLDEVRRL